MLLVATLALAAAGPSVAPPLAVAGPSVAPWLAPQEPPPSFHRQVRPILQARCQGCHQPAKAKLGVDLTSHAAILRGGKDGPILEAGDAAASLLIDVLLPLGAEPPDMPEEGEPLSDDEIALLRAWINAGAHDDTPPALARTIDAEHPPLYLQPPVLTSLAWSPDGELLAVSGHHEVLLHAPQESDQTLLRLIGMSERIQDLAFSPDGGRLAVAAGSPARIGELQIWTVPEGKLSLSLPVSYDTIYGVSWSPDGSRVAFGCADNSVRVVEAESGREILFQGAHSDWVLGTEFSADASHLVTISRDRSMKLYKIESDQFIDNITSITPGALKGGLLSVQRRPGVDQLLVGGADGTPRLYRMFREKKRVIGDDFNLIRAFDALPGRIYAVAFQADGSRFAAGSSWSGRGMVQFAQVEDGATLWRQDISAAVYDLSFHPHLPRLSIACSDGWVRTLSTEDGSVIDEFLPVPLQDSAQ